MRVQIPSDAQYYFLWRGVLYIYKKDRGYWYWYSNNSWCESMFLIVWRFGYYQTACGYMHKLNKIQKGGVD